MERPVPPVRGPSPDLVESVGRFRAAAYRGARTLAPAPVPASLAGGEALSATELHWAGLVAQAEGGAPTTALRAWDALHAAGQAAVASGTGARFAQTLVRRAAPGTETYARAVKLVAQLPWGESRRDVAEAWAEGEVLAPDVEPPWPDGKLAQAAEAGAAQIVLGAAAAGESMSAVVQWVDARGADRVVDALLRHGRDEDVVALLQAEMAAVSTAESDARPAYQVVPHLDPVRQARSDLAGTVEAVLAKAEFDALFPGGAPGPVVRPLLDARRVALRGTSADVDAWYQMLWLGRDLSAPAGGTSPSEVLDMLEPVRGDLTPEVRGFARRRGLSVEALVNRLQMPLSERPAPPRRTGEVITWREVLDGAGELGAVAFLEAVAADPTLLPPSRAAELWSSVRVSRGGPAASAFVSEYLVRTPTAMATAPMGVLVDWARHAVRGGTALEVNRSVFGSALSPDAAMRWLGAVADARGRRAKVALEADASDWDRMYAALAEEALGRFRERGAGSRVVAVERAGLVADARAMGGLRGLAEVAEHFGDVHLARAVREAQAEERRSLQEYAALSFDPDAVGPVPADGAEVSASVALALGLRAADPALRWAWYGALGPETATVLGVPRGASEAPDPSDGVVDSERIAATLAIHLAALGSASDAEQLIAELLAEVPATNGPNEMMGQGAGRAVAAALGALDHAALRAVARAYAEQRGRSLAGDLARVGALARFQDQGDVFRLWSELVVQASAPEDHRARMAAAADAASRAGRRTGGGALSADTGLPWADHIAAQGDAGYAALAAALAAGEGPADPASVRASLDAAPLADPGANAAVRAYALAFPGALTPEEMPSVAAAARLGGWEAALRDRLWAAAPAAALRFEVHRALGSDTPDGGSAIGLFDLAQWGAESNSGPALYYRSSGASSRPASRALSWSETARLLHAAAAVTGGDAVLAEAADAAGADGLAAAARTRAVLAGAPVPAAGDAGLFAFWRALERAESEPAGSVDAARAEASVESLARVYALAQPSPQRGLMHLWPEPAAAANTLRWTAIDRAVAEVVAAGAAPEARRQGLALGLAELSGAPALRRDAWAAALALD